MQAVFLGMAVGAADIVRQAVIQLYKSHFESNIVFFRDQRKLLSNPSQQRCMVCTAND